MCSPAQWDTAGEFGARGVGVVGSCFVVCWAASSGITDAVSGYTIDSTLHLGSSVSTKNLKHAQHKCSGTTKHKQLTPPPRPPRGAPSLAPHSRSFESYFLSDSPSTAAAAPAGASATPPAVVLGSALSRFDNDVAIGGSISHGAGVGGDRGTSRGVVRGGAASHHRGGCWRR